MNFYQHVSSNLTGCRLEVGGASSFIQQDELIFKLPVFTHPRLFSMTVKLLLNDVENNFKDLQ